MSTITKCDKCGITNEKKDIEFIEGCDRDGINYSLCEGCNKAFTAAFNEQISESVFDGTIHCSTVENDDVTVLEFFMQKYQTQMLKWLKKRLK